MLNMIAAMAAFKLSALSEESREAAQSALTALNAELKQQEFRMQRAWGIPEDPEYHTWWLRSAQCTCPKIDNMDPLVRHPIVAQDCPVHGVDK